MIYRILITLCFFLHLVSDANASMSDSEAKMFMELARQNITQAKLHDGSFVPAETEEEKKTPIIPVLDGQRVIQVGFRSGVAAWCKVDNKDYYLGFMQQERGHSRWTDKQIAYIGLLHGVAKGSVLRATETTACPDTQLRQIESILKNKDYD